MQRGKLFRHFVAGLAALAGLSVASVAGAQGGNTLAPGKAGGVLNVLTREDLTEGFAIHESATISTIWPAHPCFNNLVAFDPVKPLEGFDTVVPELAERWSWQDGYRNLVFFLRKGVRWHDGQPFTARDVKFTFDMVREAPDATAKLRVNPRRDWYANVEAIETPDPHTVIFRLKRPQPSLLLMLASGQSPVYPAHVPPAEQRARCVGTGPFKLKEWKRGEYVDLVRNPDYFVKGRPYLDGLRYLIVTERGTRTAALQAGRADAASPLDGSPQIAAQLRAAVPGMVITQVGAAIADNLLLNITKPPFNDPRVRHALSDAIDRTAFVKAVLQGAGIPGAALAPKPIGFWGLTGKDVVAAGDKPRARQLLAAAGYTATSPLKVEVVTRNLALYRDMASFVLNELRQVGVEATLRIIETPQWYGIATRKDFQIGANISGYGVDDPDSNFFEHYLCRSSRNYTGYCDETTEKLIEQQSRELDVKKRQALVARIQKKLDADAARPMLAWRYDYYAHWPYVKNLFPRHSAYSYGRMQEVWLDR
jgi:peptide/nickel transport system substrate-binding protein